MTRLPNYLRSHRKRFALTQSEVAFLLGVHDAAKVCRDEHFFREPTLSTAFAYQVIFQKPAEELFAGLFLKVEQDVAARAKVLTFRKNWKPGKPTDHKRQMLAQLVSIIGDKQKGYEL